MKKLLMMAALALGIGTFALTDSAKADHRGYSPYRGHVHRSYHYGFGHGHSHWYGSRFGHGHYHHPHHHHGHFGHHHHGHHHHGHHGHGHHHGSGLRFSFGFFR
jgi:hypothetical protein